MLQPRPDPSASASVSQAGWPGLIWAWVFDAEGRATPLGGRPLEAVLSDPEASVWLHFNLADLRGRDWIAERSPLPEGARALLLEDDDHLSLVAEDGALVGVFADFRREFDHGTQDLARLRFVLSGPLLVTCRRHALHAVEEVRGALLSGRSFEGGGLGVLESIFENFAAQVGAVARELSGQIEKIEDRVVDETVAAEDVRLGPIRRTALKLNRQLGALRLHFSAFVDNAGEDQVPEAVAAMVERVALRLDTVGREIEAIQERARILQEEVAAKAAAETNRQLSALSGMTALFLPATLVTGLFGMNTHGLPFESSPSGFWLAFLCGGLGSAAVYLYLRWLGLMK